MQSYVIELREAVEQAMPHLLSLSDEESAQSRAEGKWSPREIIGHLIDSASNNHQRFVRAQFQDDLIFPRYAQEDWVRVQDYNHAPWQELLTLWQSYNLQLARVMAAVPEEIRLREHNKHNLHQIGWQTIPQDKPATLDYLMSDYVAHLKNHLRQILGGEQ
ncbi:MAG: DinB family protein [Pyrinomonadaceae bacterium]|nr:DinB family protein [Pyrinomonadaceae bacterium]